MSRRLPVLQRSSLAYNRCLKIRVPRRQRQVRAQAPSLRPWTRGAHCRLVAQRAAVGTRVRAGQVDVAQPPVGGRTRDTADNLTAAKARAVVAAQRRHRVPQMPQLLDNILHRRAGSAVGQHTAWPTTSGLASALGAPGRCKDTPACHVPRQCRPPAAPRWRRPRGPGRCKTCVVWPRK